MESDYPDVISAQSLTGCVIDGCGKKLVARGRCRNHYMQWSRRTEGQARPPALNLKTKTPEERFWEDVMIGQHDECWPWMGATHDFGHGSFFVSPERKKVSAHTFAVELTTGERCPPGKEGCHRCDNPPCCNPEHVYYGTRKQNVGDMWSRGRAARGSARLQAKLDENQVLAIREKFAAGVGMGELVREYGVSDASISNVVNGKTWKHVGGPTGTHGRPGRRPNRKEAA